MAKIHESERIKEIQDYCYKTKLTDSCSFTKTISQFYFPTILIQEMELLSHPFLCRWTQHILWLPECICAHRYVPVLSASSHGAQCEAFPLVEEISHHPTDGAIHSSFIPCNDCELNTIFIIISLSLFSY